MNSKGQIAMVGTLLVTFIAVIVALAMFNGGITTNVGGAVSTQSSVD